MKDYYLIILFKSKINFTRQHQRNDVSFWSEKDDRNWAERLVDLIFPFLMLWSLLHNVGYSRSILSFLGIGVCRGFLSSSCRSH